MVAERRDLPGEPIDPTPIRLNSFQKSEVLSADEIVRLIELEVLLDKAKLSPRDRADFTVEKMFLELKSGVRDWKEHREVLAGFLDQQEAGIRHYIEQEVIDERGRKSSHLLQIRDRLISPEQFKKITLRK